MLIANYKDRSWRESLGLKSVAAKAVGLWLLVYAAYFSVQSLLNHILKVDMGDVFNQALGSKHLGVFLSIALLAPIVEELVFRGYLFNAWRNTRLGLIGTLLLTSLIFAAVHGAQYSWVLLVYLFIFSVILGLAREKIGSTVTPIILHVVNNTLAGFLMIYLGLS